MKDRIIIADASKVSAREFLDMFKPRIDPAEARLAIKFAEAFGKRILPEWVEAAKEDQLTRCDPDPLEPKRRAA